MVMFKGGHGEPCKTINTNPVIYVSLTRVLQILCSDLHSIRHVWYYFGTTLRIFLFQGIEDNRHIN